MTKDLIVNNLNLISTEIGNNDQMEPVSYSNGWRYTVYVIQALEVVAVVAAIVLLFQEMLIVAFGVLAFAAACWIAKTIIDWKISKLQEHADNEISNKVGALKGLISTYVLDKHIEINNNRQNLINYYNNEINLKDSTILQRNNTINEKDIKIVEKDGEILRLKGEIEDLEKQAKEFAESETGKKITDLEEKYEKLEDRYSKDIKVDVNALDSENKELKDKVDGLKKIKKEYEERLTKITTENSNLRILLKRTQESKDLFFNDFREELNKTSKLEEKIKELTMELENERLKTVSKEVTV